MMSSYKKANGLLVVSKQEGAVVGRFDDFQFDLESLTIYGYRIKGSGMFAKAGGVRGDLLDVIGRDVAFIQSEADVEWSAARQAEDGRAWASKYLGTRVIGRNGVSVGVVEDIAFSPAQGVRGLILDGNRMVELDERVSTGPAAIVIDDPERVADMTEESPEEDEHWWNWLTKPSKSSKPETPDTSESADKPAEDD